MPVGYKTRKVKAREAAEAKIFEDYGVNATRVLQEIARLGFTDMRQFFDEHGNLKAIKDLTADQGAALAGFEVIKKNAAAGDGVVDTVHKFKVWDKPKALEMLAKHLGLFVEKTEVTGTLEITWKGETG